MDDDLVNRPLRKSRRCLCPASRTSCLYALLFIMMILFCLLCRLTLTYQTRWFTFSSNVSLTVFFVHTVVLPILFVFSRKSRAIVLYLPYTWPFERQNNPKTFGLDGARNISIKYESTFDKCTIDIGVWHLLPKSLVKKHRYLIDNGSKNEINNLFDEELKNSEHPIFLYFHGIVGSRATGYRVEMYKILQNLDAHVVTFDYRGFGDSTNVTPTKIGMVEDGLLVYSWIRGLVGSKKPVFIWGHSIGSGISQRAFSKLTQYSHTLLGLKTLLPPPQGMILEGGYHSNVELSKDYVAGQIAAWLPYLRRIMLNTMMDMENRIIPENYVSQLKQYPLLILHSRDDRVIPYNFGKTLYEKHVEARKEGGAPVTFKTFEAEGHWEIYTHPWLPGMVQEYLKNST